MLKVISIGGFGHSEFVFNDMIGMRETELCGLAPAYAGEDISFFTSHQLCKGVKTYGDYRSMIKDVKPDVAVISTRLDMIPNVILDAVNSGCHIIAEKPLALDYSTLETVYAAIKNNRVHLTAMLSMRSEPQFIAAREAYKNNLIGEAVVVNGRKSYKWGKRPEWFGEKEKYGGTIGWVGIHALDFINFVTGFDFTKVGAMSSNFSHPERRACDDNCIMALELSNGGHATVSVDLCRPERAKTHGDDWIRVVGTKGIIEARGVDNSCTLLINGKGPETIKLPDRKKIFRDFLLSLDGNSECEIFEEESFMLTHVCLLAQESAEEKIFIDLDDVILKYRKGF